MWAFQNKVQVQSLRTSLNNNQWKFFQMMIVPQCFFRFSFRNRLKLRTNCEVLSSIWSFIRSSKYMFHIFTFSVDLVRFLTFSSNLVFNSILDEHDENLGLFLIVD